MEFGEILERELSRLENLMAEKRDEEFNHVYDTIEEAKKVATFYITDLDLNIAEIKVKPKGTEKWVYSVQLQQPLEELETGSLTDKTQTAQHNDKINIMSGYNKITKNSNEKWHKMRTNTKLKTSKKRGSIQYCLPGVLVPEV